MTRCLFAIRVTAVCHIVKRIEPFFSGLCQELNCHLLMLFVWMSVSLRHLHSAVPKQLLDGDKINSPFDQARSKGVPKIMKPQTSDASFPAGCLECPFQILERLACFWIVKYIIVTSALSVRRQAVSDSRADFLSCGFRLS